MPRPNPLPGWPRRLVVPAVLFGLLVLFHGGLVWGTLVLCGGDIVNNDVPWRWYWTHHGPLTGWYASSFSGYPFFANIQAGVLYPPNWLYFSGLPVERTTTLLVLGHLALGGWGFYRMARLRLELAPALVAAALWMCGGYQMLRLTNGVVIFTYTLAWLPWIWWAAERCGADNPRATARLALFGAMQILAGSPQVVHITWGGCLLWMLLRVLFERTRRARLALLAHGAAAGVLAVMIAFPQLAATREFAAGGAGRSAGPDWQYLTDGSLEPRALWTGLFPELFDAGNREETYWGTQAGYLEMNAYIGIAALALALFAVAALLPALDRRRDRRWMIGFAALALTGLLIALGRHTPLYRLLFHAVPGFDLFRVPARWQVWLVAPLCLLAGWGIQLLCQTPGEPTPPRRLWAWVGAVGGLLLLCVLVRAALDPLLRALGLHALPLARVPEAVERWQATAAGAVTWALGMLVAAGALGLAVLRGRLSSRLGIALIVGVLVIDLLRFWHPYREPLPTDIHPHELPSEAPFHRIRADAFREWFYPETELVAEMRARTDGRFVYTDDFIGFHFDQFARELSGERPAVFGLAGMRGYQPLQWAPYVEEFGALLPADLRDLAFRSSSLRLPELGERWPLDAYNATHVLSYLPAVVTGQERHFEALGLRRVTRLATGLEIWENPHAAGWAWVSTDATWPGLDGRQPEADVVVVERTPDAVRLVVDVPEPGGTLHFAEVDYPGWRIRVRRPGSARVVLEETGRSIRLPEAGTYDVERVLRLPAATRASLAPSFLMGLVTAGFALGLLRRQRDECDDPDGGPEA